jgi:hypothetical protein
MDSLARYKILELISKALAQHDGMRTLGLETKFDQPTHPWRLRSSKLIKTSGVEMYDSGATSCASGKKQGRVS